MSLQTGVGRQVLKAGPAPDARVLTLLAASCASASGLALILHWAGLIRMPAAVSFIVVPASLALVAIMVRARGRYQPMLNRFTVGVVGGLVATLVYDGSRWLLRTAFSMTFDPFRAHSVFGSLMLGITASDPMAVAAGWFYHFYNGVGFAVMYALVAGPVRWPWAVVWALLLETAMVVTYPDLLGVRVSDPNFLILSISGHVLWGITLGVLVERAAMPGPLTVARPRE